MAGIGPGKGLLNVELVIVPESEVARLLTRQDCFEAVERVFASMAHGTACNFPVVRERLGHADALYGFKSGFDRESLALGLKSGGFWPGNVERGLTNHQSTIFLFDADTGQCRALVGGNLLTALRTAAASAVSIRYLARADSRTLGMIGAGHQSTFQLRAALEQRQFSQVLGWNRNPQALDRLAAVATEAGVPFEAVGLEELGGRSDVIVSIISSFAPVLLAHHVRPGTHIACMGTDTKGKQEIDAALVASARRFTDEIAQSISIGEFQHATASGTIEEGAITAIGRVVNGTAPGRTNDEEITIFDGTGVGLQDLAVAAAVVDRVNAGGEGIRVTF